MPKFHQTVLLFILVVLLTSCAAPVVVDDQPAPLTMPDIQIVRHPEPVNYNWLNTYTEPPSYDPNSTNPWQVDLRSAYLENLDLSRSGGDLIFATFDSKTRWPATDKMPIDFDWQKIMEIGKDPGLGMRSLHEQGITGKGIGIAIIDQTLLVDHVEYKDRIHVYEESDDITNGWLEVQMHGPAVAAIAVGKSVGVAPESDLYFIAGGDCGGASSIEDLDFSCRAKDIRRIVEINKTLPANRKIRVLSLSFGWSRQNKGYDEISAAVEAARDTGIFVISSSISETYGLNFHGLGREPLSDPNEFTSYGPGQWWQTDFYEQGLSRKRLMAPMDARTTASPTGTEDYVFYRTGGWSWSIPYLAGTYALAAQVKPDITPEEFWNTALKTGRTIQLQHDGKEYEFGIILDPQALIQALKNK